MNIRKYSVQFINIIFVLCYFIYLLATKDVENSLLVKVDYWIRSRFDWLYYLFANLSLFFCVFLVFGKTGNIRIGGAEQKPIFSFWVWETIIISAGVGVSLVYFCFSEPLIHYLRPPEIPFVHPSAAKNSIFLTFHNFGLHGWSIYILFTVSFALLGFQQGQSARVSFVSNAFGFKNKTVEKFMETIIALITVIGFSLSFAFGVTQIASGIEFFFKVEDGVALQLFLTIFITALILLSSMGGLLRGIQFFSVYNIFLSLLFVAIIVFSGPILEQIKEFSSNIGIYLGNIGHVYPFLTDASVAEWSRRWPLIYWAWWLTWGPVIGVFFTKISTGRTIREVIFGCAVIPVVYVFIWIQVSGKSVLNFALSNKSEKFRELVFTDQPKTIFLFLQNHPLYLFLSILVFFILFIGYLTSADSACYTLTNLEGEKSQERFNKYFWPIIFGVFTLVSLLFGGIKVFVSMVVIASLPCLIMGYFFLFKLIRRKEF